MNNGKPLVGVVYEVYIPNPKAADKELSEETVEEMAREVYEAVLALGYPAVLIPVKDSFLGFLRRIQEVKPDVVVNLCESFDGTTRLESNVAGVYELLRVSFTGNVMRSLSLCQDKFRAKAVLSAHGLPTPPACLVHSVDEVPPLKFPVICKPNGEDASMGITPRSVARDEAGLRTALASIRDRFGLPVLAEEFIDGREFNVAVMAEGAEARALPVSEIDFSALPKDQPRIISYEAKWFETSELYIKTPPVCPADIEDDIRLRLQNHALEAFRVLGCRDYARVDFRMDKKGRLFILEVNPNPDVSLNAGYARALKAAGIEYGDFWKLMIRNAQNRNGKS
ncbi:MAG: ATP-grasp domain-containing protein [Candidatus Aminicenantes bacterium]|nr:ATP-grasp domain-containing protein [Candidatus Aminicenantes bacterium]